MEGSFPLIKNSGTMHLFQTSKLFIDVCSIRKEKDFFRGVYISELVILFTFDRLVRILSFQLTGAFV
ncbi:hypothetical protein GCM10008967_42380 [Bacillus carboniphilus]|uniref:Uncharacterized protein n=1 Tax=Bacillus carboniphilus TaxID=86663 RepID=A0ABN0WVE0_9BACI